MSGKEYKTLDLLKYLEDRQSKGLDVPHDMLSLLIYEIKCGRVALNELSRIRQRI